MQNKSQSDKMPYIITFVHIFRDKDNVNRTQWQKKIYFISRLRNINFHKHVFNTKLKI